MKKQRTTTKIEIAAKRISFTFCLLMIIQLVTSSCEEENPMGMEFDRTSITMEVQETDTLTITSNVGSSEVIWESSNPEVAIIGERGGILAVKEGLATITATVEEASAVCEVTVIEQSIE